MQEEEEGTSIKTVIRDSSLILLFELMGTAFLTLFYSIASRYQEYSSLTLGIFILIIFGAKISGSHYNPSVTLSFMLRKDVGRFSRVLGVAYIIF